MKPARHAQRSTALAAVLCMVAGCGQSAEDPQIPAAAIPADAIPADAIPAAEIPAAESLRPASQKRTPLTSGEMTASFAPVVRTAAPAVVNIYTSRTTASNSPFAQHPFFERFFGQPGLGTPRARPNSSLGSGVIVGEDGIIVTNNHVVEGADHLRVVLTDRREFNAIPVLTDKRADLAVLKIDAGDDVFPTLEFADTRTLEVGDLVLAIGNPFGVGQTVTSGIVSALARTDVGVSDYSFFIQTDAAINPGNSGGALVDVFGRLVGVNTAIYSRSGGSNGIGFAIPAEMVRRVVVSALKGGRVVKPWLGLKGQGIDADLSRSLGMARPLGVLVTEVYPDGPAHKAGLKRGDVITAVNDREVFDHRGLRFMIATRQTSEKVVLDVISNHAPRAVTVQLDAPPAAETGPRFLAGHHPLSGAAVSDLSPSLAEELGLDPFANGVVIVSIAQSSVAARIGLQPGDVLRSVNRANTNSTDELDAVLISLGRKTKLWSLSFERAGRTHNLSARL